MRFQVKADWRSVNKDVPEVTAGPPLVSNFISDIPVGEALIA